MADQNFLNNELQAANPMAYLGVRATIPPNYYKIRRPPTTKDYAGYVIGDFWLDTSSLYADPATPPTTANLWNLVDKDAGVATWINFAGGIMSAVLQIQGDSGGAQNPNSSGIFFFSGGTTGLAFNGTTNTETLTGTLAIANGGTNATSMTNTDGVVYFDGTRLVTTTVGSATQVLTSNGPGMPPTFQAAGGGGSGTYTYTNVNTSPYVVLISDNYISVDSSGGAITIELPNAATSGRFWVIKDRTGSAGTVGHNITIQSVSGAVNIDGSTSFVMNTAYESVMVMGNGSTYEVF